MTSLFTGADLADPLWLTQRIEETGRRWRTSDRRTAATLWWYSASSVLLAPLFDDTTIAGTVPDPSLDATSGALQADGTPARVTYSRRVEDLDGLGDRLRRSLIAIVDALEQAGGAAPAMWALASDSLANRALDAGSATLAVRLAELVGPPLPVPRFVEVGSRTFLRRASCCLIYRVVASEGDEAAERAKCVSCPHQLPEVRRARLAAL